MAEIAKFTPEQMSSYEDSLKYYRDLKNSLDTACDEGKTEGEKSAAERIARELLSKGIAMEVVITTTGLTAEDIERIERDGDK